MTSETIWLTASGACLVAAALIVGPRAFINAMFCWSIMLVMFALYMLAVPVLLIFGRRPS